MGLGLGLGLELGLGLGLRLGLGLGIAVEGEHPPRTAAVVAPLGGDACLDGDRAEAALQVGHAPEAVTAQQDARAPRHGAGDGRVTVEPRLRSGWGIG